MRAAGARWDEPAERLGLFVHRAEELLRSRVVRSGMPTGLNMRWSVDQPWALTLRQPDEEDLRSMLLSFRLFMMQGEPTFLPTIMTLCSRHLTSDELKAGLVNARRDWLARLKSGGIRLEVNGRHLSPEHLIDLWINGWYFHSDERKRRDLLALEMPMAILSRYVFFEAVGTGVEYVAYVRSVIMVATREGHFRFPT